MLDFTSIMFSTDKKLLDKGHLGLKTLLKEDLDLFIDLFFYEKPINLNPELSTTLENIGLIHREDNKWRANVMIFPYKGKFICTDFLLSYKRMKDGKFLRGINDVWVMFPHETLLFIDELGQIQGKTALDIASGSGAISLFLAKDFKQVYSIDINPKAVQYSKFNASLNNLDKKITNIQSDLFNSIPAIKFDHIYWNGPTVALPELINADKVYPLYTYGGYDGAAFTKKFLDEVFLHVNENYLIKWWDGSMGTKSRSVVDSYLRNKFSQMPINITIEYLNKRGGVPLKEYDDAYIKYCLDKFELNQDPESRKIAVDKWYKRLYKEHLLYVHISLITIRPSNSFKITYKYPSKTRVSAKHVYGFEWHFVSRNYIRKYLKQNNPDIFTK